jgi:hypothetical protein
VAIKAVLDLKKYHQLLPKYLLDLRSLPQLPSLLPDLRHLDHLNLERWLSSSGHLADQPYPKIYPILLEACSGSNHLRCPRLKVSFIN